MLALDDDEVAFVSLLVGNADEDDSAASVDSSAVDDMLLIMDEQITLVQLVWLDSLDMSIVGLGCTRGSTSICELSHI